jgi:subtilisin family serine protease
MKYRVVPIAFTGIVVLLAIYALTVRPLDRRPVREAVARKESSAASASAGASDRVVAGSDATGTRGMRAAPDAPMPVGHGALLAGAVRLAGFEESTARGRQRVGVYRTKFKHPLVRIVEDFAAGSQQPFRSVAMVADHVLIRLGAGDAARLDSFLRDHPETSIRQRLATGEHVLVRIPDGEKPDSFERWRQKLRAAGLDAAEPDYLYQHAETTPNDPDFPQLWALHNTGQNGGTVDADMDAPEAWDITTGSDDVVVAVLDVGVDYNHPDLAANIWSNASGKHGYDYADNDDDPMDASSSSAPAHGHGTHISGTIAGVGNNSNGVVGVCWRARIMAVRIGDAYGANSTSASIDGIRYATDNGAQVLNLSWGGQGGSVGDGLNQEIIRARDHGVLVVAAAGNSGSDNDAMHNYPSDYPEDNIISVAASDNNDALASFSNYGAASVDLAAPGKDIRSTVPNNQYTAHDGTSMATPQVVGAAALVWSADASLTYAQVRDRLLSKVDPKASLAGKVATGGRLNVFKAIEDLSGAVLSLSRRSAVVVGGNGDSYPNPGESLHLDLTLNNIGAEAAPTSTVTASLSDGAPATLNRTLWEAGDLDAHGSNALDNAFTITLGNPDVIPANFTVTLRLATSARDTVWTNTLLVTVYDPATLSGRVSRAATGLPITNAAIAIRGPVSIDLGCGPDGGYLAHAVAGDYQITARAAGFIDSETSNVTARASSPGVDFSLGCAGLAFTPPEAHVTVPPDRIRQLNVSAVHAGDTPRAIPFTTAIAGSGMGADKLYGLTMDFGTLTASVLELDPDTGSQLGSHALALGASQFVSGFCHFQTSLWVLVREFSGPNALAKLVPVSPGTWTVGDGVTIPASQDEDVVAVSATADAILLVLRSKSAPAQALYEFQHATGALTFVGSLPDEAMGPLAYSTSRNSVFTALYTGVCRELAYPSLATNGEWIVTAGAAGAMAFDEKQGALFMCVFPEGGGSTTLQKISPEGGSAIGGFSAPADVMYVAVDSAAGSSWLTSGVASTNVPCGGMRTIPLSINTAGMAAGQSFTATLSLASTMLGAPATLPVHLTVGNPPDPDTWPGWFEARCGRAPLREDEGGDGDHDGVPAYIEFATGGDPTNDIPYAGALRVDRAADGTHVEFSYHRRVSLTDDMLVPQGSTNLPLHLWATLPDTVPGSSLTNVPYDIQFDRMILSMPGADAEPVFFMRLQGHP